MSVKSVRAAIREALTQPSGCDGPKIKAAAARKITKAALADGRNSKSEQKVIADFFDARRETPDSGSVHTRACPESTSPAFDAGAKRVIEQYLSIPTRGVAGR